jgi:argininosuccinate synthase
VEGGETYTNSVELFKKLNEIAGANGVGRVDIVESRYFTLPAAIISTSPQFTIHAATISTSPQDSILY